MVDSAVFAALSKASEEFGGPVCKEFYDRTVAKCPWRTSFTEDTVMMALGTLVEMGWHAPTNGSLKPREDGGA
jgi:hypothetical protein